VTMRAQLSQIEAEIAKDKRDQQDLTNQISEYQKRLEAEPVREQEIAGLLRDYAISKEQYSQLLTKKDSAEMATQLEIRQQAEKFTILDPAQVPQKPTKPDLLMIDAGGCAAGLLLGLAAALASEFISMSITLPSQVSAATGVAVLAEIPVISTAFDRRRRKRLMIASTTSAVAAILAICAFLIFRYELF